jgi:hypothetical protein
MGFLAASIMEDKAQEDLIYLRIRKGGGSPL